MNELEMANQAHADALIAQEQAFRAGVPWELKQEKVDDTLSVRGKRYGPFDGHARITQCLKEEMWESGGWERLTPDQREALEMIAHKIGRILNGDPNYDDSWRDIAGYAMLVCNRLTGEGPQ